MALKLYTKKTKMDFGKYKGQTVGKLINKDSQYLIWCIKNVNSFNVTKSIKQELEKIAHRECSYPYEDDVDYDDPFIWEDFLNG